MELKSLIAKQGLKVPMEHASTRYITDSEPVEVAMTQYYIRRMTDGELLDAKDAAPDKYLAAQRHKLDDKEHG